MADILVTCPTCKTQLEIDAAYEGQEVECGSCLQVFVATTKKARRDDEPSGRSGGGKVRGSTSSSGRGSRGSRERDRDDDDDDRPARRRRDDDDDDYDHDRPARRRRSNGSNGLAITALILGILSIPACCCPIVGIVTSIISIVTGSMGLKNPEGKGMATAGLVLGIIGLILAIINAAAGVAMQMNPNRFR